MLATKGYLDNFINSTIRIECVLNDGTTTSGTGFFCKLILRKLHNIPVTILVTNKHVIEDSKIGYIYLPIVYENGEKDIVDYEVTNFEKRWELHSETDVDLCFMGFADFIDPAELTKNKYRFNFFTYDEKFFPEYNARLIYNALEDIIMIGYPDGIMDKVNMTPLIRKGITATNFNLDYEGKSEFLVDVPAIGGSSGSPILLFRQVLVDGEKGIKLSYEIKLLGVLYAGYDKENGDYICKRIKDIDYGEYSFNLNLGVAVKSNKILDFIPMLNKIMKKK